eukprot:TRINITY_DN25864_c0_g2_i1.p1 TRINITY_DN25864_c0_g2~~TRINITY_DN25864_c0_g2_i1.p1  ORF type:complete len:105 (+),score=4.83 TRINITY_DN25864_c0_g2_i1:107-421(+)
MSKMAQPALQLLIPSSYSSPLHSIFIIALTRALAKKTLVWYQKLDFPDVDTLLSCIRGFSLYLLLRPLSRGKKAELLSEDGALHLGLVVDGIDFAFGHIVRSTT